MQVQKPNNSQADARSPGTNRHSHNKLLPIWRTGTGSFCLGHLWNFLYSVYLWLLQNGTVQTKNKGMSHSQYLPLACSELLSPTHKRFRKFLSASQGGASEHCWDAWQRATAPQLLQTQDPVGGLGSSERVGVGRLESLIGTVRLFWSLFSHPDH